LVKPPEKHFFPDDNKRDSNHTHSDFNTPICELLKNLNQHFLYDFGIGLQGQKQRLLILSKETTQPISVDGMDPTVFTLEDFDPERGLAVFSFKKEELDSSVGVTNLKGTFVTDCHNIGGLFFLEKLNNDND
jgi:hypothetical protein